MYVAGGITVASLVAGVAAGALASSSPGPHLYNQQSDQRAALTTWSMALIATGGVAALVTTVLYGSRPAKLRTGEMATTGRIAF